MDEHLSEAAQGRPADYTATDRRVAPNPDPAEQSPMDSPMEGTGKGRGPLDSAQPADSARPAPDADAGAGTHAAAAPVTTETGLRNEPPGPGGVAGEAPGTQEERSADEVPPTHTPPGADAEGAAPVDGPATGSSPGVQVAHQAELDRATEVGRDSQPGRDAELDRATEVEHDEGAVPAPAADAGPTAGTPAAEHTPQLPPSAWQAADADLDAPLFTNGARARASWDSVQASFVDDPRGAVQQAAVLAEEIVTMLTTAAEQRIRELRDRWEGGREADTEALRNALRRYRAFVDRVCGI